MNNYEPPASSYPYEAYTPSYSDPAYETYQSQDTASEVISQGYGDPNAGEAGLSAWNTNTVAAAPPSSPEEVPQNQPSSLSPSGDLGAPSLDEVRTIEANSQQAQAELPLSDVPSNEAIVPPDIGMVVGSVGVGTMPLIGLGEGAIAAGALIGVAGAVMLGAGIGLYLTHLPPAMPIEAGHEPVRAPAPTATSIPEETPQPIPVATPSPIRVEIPQGLYPESASHILDAQNAGWPSELTIAREDARENRHESLEGISTVPGFARDEYPPAMFEEGGAGASVRYVPPSDNRGAGSCIGHQCAPYPNGTTIEIVVIP